MDGIYRLPFTAVDQEITEFNSDPLSCSLADLVSNSSGTLYLENENSEEYYINLCSETEFTCNGQTAELIGGVLYPQGPNKPR